MERLQGDRSKVQQRKTHSNPDRTLSCVLKARHSSLESPECVHKSWRNTVCAPDRNTSRHKLKNDLKARIVQHSAPHASRKHADSVKRMLHDHMNATVIDDPVTYQSAHLKKSSLAGSGQGWRTRDPKRSTLRLHSWARPVRADPTCPRTTDTGASQQQARKP